MSGLNINRTFISSRNLNIKTGKSNIMGETPAPASQGMPPGGKADVAPPDPSDADLQKATREYLMDLEKRRRREKHNRYKRNGLFKLATFLVLLTLLFAWNKIQEFLRLRKRNWCARMYIGATTTSEKGDEPPGGTTRSPELYIEVAQLGEDDLCIDEHEFELDDTGAYDGPVSRASDELLQKIVKMELDPELLFAGVAVKHCVESVVAERERDVVVDNSHEACYPGNAADAIALCHGRFRSGKNQHQAMRYLSCVFSQSHLPPSSRILFPMPTQEHLLVHIFYISSVIVHMGNTKMRNAPFL